MDAMMIVSVCLIALLSSGVSAKIAAGKCRNPLLWGAIGLVFSLVGLLLVTVVPDRALQSMALRYSTGTARNARAAVA